MLFIRAEGGRDGSQRSSSVWVGAVKLIDEREQEVAKRRGDYGAERYEDEVFQEKVRRRPRLPSHAAAVSRDGAGCWEAMHDGSPLQPAWKRGRIPMPRGSALASGWPVQYGGPHADGGTVMVCSNGGSWLAAGAVAAGHAAGRIERNKDNGVGEALLSPLFAVRAEGIARGGQVQRQLDTLRVEEPEGWEVVDASKTQDEVRSVPHGRALRRTGARAPAMRRLEACAVAGRSAGVYGRGTRPRACALSDSRGRQGREGRGLLPPLAAGSRLAPAGAAGRAGDSAVRAGVPPYL